jgi:RNA polymerase sigma factor (sigma-70 family)
MPSDGELIERSIAQPGVFEAIFDRHYDPVYGYLSRQVGASVAEELTQEVFLVAFRRRGAFRTNEGSARPWLLGIATNLARRHFRHRTRTWRAYRRQASSPESGSEDPWTEADDRLEADSMAVKLRGAMAGLNDDLRAVLLLYALGSLTYPEIAEALEIPIGTVRSRLARARRRMRGELDVTVEGDDG